MPRAKTGTLVIGAGHAGLSLVTTLRDLGDDAPITLVGDEALPPYDRPPLSKTYLRGERDRDSLVFHPSDWFGANDIELVKGDPVTSIERVAGGGTATTAGGLTIEFERLALTTGARSRALDVDGRDLDGVLSLRDVADADRLASALSEPRRLVVVGGGFIGLEVAASARALGHTVTVVELTDRLMGRAVTPAVSDFYRDWHEGHGTRVVLGARVDGLAGVDGAVSTVEVAGGESIPCDVVVVGVGASPRTELARALGLAVDPGGIVVDAAARASDGSTVAAGDCAIGANPYVRGLPGPMRLESVQHATDQARTAAATLLGHAAAYTEMPWFWSDQGDLRLQIAGLTGGADLSVVRGDPATAEFSVLSYREGLLIAAECIGSPADYLAVKRGLEKGMTIDPEAAQDASTPLKRLLVSA